jgi:predicted enzyme related to lactoylglutathione lyase
MAVLADVGGAVIGAWQPGRHTGFGVVHEVGSADWFELDTRDYEASVRFYRNVFGWDTHVMSDSSDFRYTTLGEGDRAVAGIMDVSASPANGAPSHWVVLFRVEDTDATVAKATELGGSVVSAAADSPYGRLATLADPTGATFGVIAHD